MPKGKCQIACQKNTGLEDTNDEWNSVKVFSSEEYTDNNGADPMIWELKVTNATDTTGAAVPPYNWAWNGTSEIDVAIVELKFPNTSGRNIVVYFSTHITPQSKLPDYDFFGCKIPVPWASAPPHTLGCLLAIYPGQVNFTIPQALFAAISTSTPAEGDIIYWRYRTDITFYSTIVHGGTVALNPAPANPLQLSTSSFAYITVCDGF